MGLKTKKEFPVGECIKGCFLHDIGYTTFKQPDGEMWEGLKLSVRKDKSWIAIWIKSISRKEFDEHEKYVSRKYQTGLAIERILALYLDSHEMIEFRNGLENIKGFKNYCDYVSETIKSKDYKKVSLDLKTNMREDGRATVFPFGVFIKRSDDIHKVLQYSDWEEERHEKLLNKH